MRATMVLGLWVALASRAGADGCSLSLLNQAPLRAAGKHLFTELGIGGHRANMVVDTGAFVSILSADAAKRYDVRTSAVATTRGVGAGGSRLSGSERTASYAYVAGVGGGQVANFVTPDQVSFGQSHGRIALVAAAWVAPQTDPPTDGLIGSDVLATADLDLDIMGGKLSFYKVKGACDTPPVTLDGDLYQADLLTDQPNERRPFVTAVVDKVRLRALIDTGAAHTIVTRDAARRLGINYDALAARGPTIEMNGVGNRTAKGVAAVLPSFKMGEVAIANLPIVVADIDLGEDDDMLVGSDFLRRTHVWISNSHHKIVFQLPPRPSP